jgi:hypothetical protein
MSVFAFWSPFDVFLVPLGFVRGSVFWCFGVWQKCLLVLLDPPHDAKNVEK